MGALIDILKSRGKLGGIALMVIGLGTVAYSYMKGLGDYQTGMVTFFVGLGILGIRAKQDPPAA